MSLQQDMDREMGSYIGLLAAAPNMVERVDWVRRKIGAVDALPVIKSPIGISRIEVDPDTLLWQPTPEVLKDAKQGPALILPVTSDTDELVDLLAVHPDDAAWFWLRYGHAEILGERHLSYAIMHGEPVLVYDSPLSMLRAFASAWSTYIKAKRDALTDFQAMGAAIKPDWQIDAENADGLPTDQALVLLRLKVQKRLMALKPPDWADFGCCLLDPEADTEKLFGRATRLVTDNPSYGLFLQKSMKSSRAKRRNREQPLPPVVPRIGRALTGIDPPAMAEDEDQAA